MDRKTIEQLEQVSELLGDSIVQSTGYSWINPTLCTVKELVDQILEEHA